MGRATALLTVLAVACSSVATERWRWPDARDAAPAEARVDRKVGFIDAADAASRADEYGYDDELAFHQPQDTQGFYNRPPGAGRYRVRVEPHSATRLPFQYNSAARLRIQNVFNTNSVERQQSDGTLDSFPYCKCVDNPDCPPRTYLKKACASGLNLCCYSSEVSSNQNSRQSDIFNEVEDGRSHLLPGQGALQGPFPPRPEQGFQSQQATVLVGPEGPTGNIGPPNTLIQSNSLRQNINDEDDIGGNFRGSLNPGVLVGPGGPTGVIGPAPNNYAERESLASQENLDILVGPEGPTGIIGPSQFKDDNRGSASAQNGILVGPGGPTGIIGPRGYGRPILVGPGGPTGNIGPRGYYGRPNPGILVGPGGPTGVIGPRRGVLVGPGGPTGQIGPRNYFYGK